MILALPQVKINTLRETLRFTNPYYSGLQDIDNDHLKVVIGPSDYSLRAIRSYSLPKKMVWD
jgi:hypothetical protein